LRTLLAHLDDAGIEADELTVHTPDLDDVFFALTADTHRTDHTADTHQPKENAR
ncbi:ABC transporter, partial [Streptomyces sp. NPDC058954]